MPARTANRKSRRASASNKPAAKKARAKAKTQAPAELPKLNTKQKARLKAIYDRFINMESEHSRLVRRNRAAEAAVEKQIETFNAELGRTASSMIESVGLDPNHPEISFSVDPTTGIITQKLRPKPAPPPPPSENGAGKPEPPDTPKN